MSDRSGVDKKPLEQKIKIMTENQFRNFAQNTGASNTMLKDFIYVQCNTKSKVGSGTPIVVHFFAKMNLVKEV